MAITYEEMTPSAQAKFDKTNKFRTMILKATWIGYAVDILSYVLLGISFIIGASTEETPYTLFGIVLFIMVVGVIPMFILGIVHCKFFFKKIWNASPVIIFNWLIIAFTFMLGAMFVAFSCPIFAIIDTVRFFQKKPLIYSYEYSNFV